jgi:GDPmannose 4,6-dehydratase
MYLILQQDQADDYVIATGVTTTIRDFIKMSFAETGIDLEFKGNGVDEIGIISNINESIFSNYVGEQYLENIKTRIGEQVIGVDPSYFRPTEVDILIGDATKARTKLNWTPEYDLDGLVKDMMKSDLKLMQKDSYLREGGYSILNYFE